MVILFLRGVSLVCKGFVISVTLNQFVHVHVHRTVNENQIWEDYLGTKLRLIKRAHERIVIWTNH